MSELILSAILVGVVVEIILLLLTGEKERIQTFIRRLLYLTLAAAAIVVAVHLFITNFSDTGQQVSTQFPTSTAFRSFRVEVIYDGADGLNLRNSPNGDIIATLLENSELIVVGNAVDADGFRWWPVELEIGWIAEGRADELGSKWLESVDANVIKIDQRVKVVYSGSDGLNLRHDPDPGSDKIATFLEGSYLRVIGGPEIGGGFKWWHVSVAPGWIAEGSVNPSAPRWFRTVRY
jgi:hypothetical protein